MPNNKNVNLYQGSHNGWVLQVYSPLCTTNRGWYTYGVYGTRIAALAAIAANNL